MNDELGEFVKAYATKPHKELNALLLGKSKDGLIALLNSLITQYMNDKNSSTLREFVTVSLAGYKQKETKIGYNGYKQSTEVGGKPIACEAKPRNIDTEGNKKIKTPRKHDGGGNFTDYTLGRLRKDKKENPNMLASGFVDGQLMFILEFPFSCPHFTKNLKEQLKRRFPSGDRPNQYLRSARFTFKNYKDCKNLKLVHLDEGALKAHRGEFSPSFYDFLLDLKSR